MTGVGIALVLSQLLTVSQQIAVNNHVQSVLGTEMVAMPLYTPLRSIVYETLWQGQCCPPPTLAPPLRSSDNQPTPPPFAHPVARVAPNYPQHALNNSVDGYVDFVFTVDPNGSPMNGKVSADVPQGYGFAEAAIAVFSKWKFRPELPGRTVMYRISFRHWDRGDDLPALPNHR